MSTTTTTVGIRLQLEGANAVERGILKVQSHINDVAKDFAKQAAGVLSAAAFTSWIKGAIDAADETGKLAQKTGLLTEQVAGLKLAFDQAGVGDKFSETMVKLAKEAAEGNKAFAAMGISVKDATGTLKSTRDLLGEVAGKFSGYADGSQKTALAIQLLGKSGADAIPLLNGGAQALDEFDRKAKQLGLTISGETARAAEQFNDQLDLVLKRSQGVGIQLSNSLLPALVQVSDAFAKGAQNGGAMEAVGAGIATVFETVAVVGVNVGYVLTQVGKELGGLAAQAAQVAQFNFSAAGEIGRAMKADAAEARREVDALSDRIINARRRIAIGVSSPDDQSSAESRRLGLDRLKTEAPLIEQNTRATGRNTAAKKANTDAEREAARAAAELAKTRERISALADKETEDISRRVAGLIESNESLRDEIAMVGASVDKRAELVSLKEREAIAQMQLNLIDAQSKGASVETILLMQQEINLRRQRLALIDEKAAAESANTVQQETYAALRNIGQRADTEWDRTADYLGEALAGGIAAGFSEGKGFADGFFKYLGNQLKQAFAQELSNSIKGGVQSYLTGNNSGMMNSAVGAAWQYYTGSSAGASSASLAYANAVGASGGDSIGALYAANGGWAGVSTGASGAAATTAGTSAAGGSAAAAGSSSMMAYAGYAALIYAAVKYGEKLYGEGYNRNMLGSGQSQSYTYGYNNRTNGYTDSAGYGGSFERAKRSTLDPVMSDKWADILSGTTRYAHMFARKLSAYGYNIGIDGSNVSVGGYESYRPGWAGRLMGRNTKTFTSDVDSRDAAMVQTQVEAVREGSRSMAAAMGMSAEAIDKYTGTLRVNMKGADTAAEQSERMAKAMDDLQFSLLKAAAGGKYSREEFDRMMTGVRESMESVGVTGEAIAGILVQGMTGRLSSAEVGDQLASTIVGGIYTAIASQYAGIIAQAFTTQIITPIFTALAAGVPISQAISQAAINNVVATANQAAAALNAIFNDAGFLSAIAGIQQAISGVTGAVGSISVPEINNGLAEAEAQRYQIESELLGILGNTAALRERELAGLDGSARALKLHVYALQDSRAAVEGAMSALQRSADAERDRLTGLLDMATEAESGLNDVFKTLRDSIRALRGEVTSTASMDSRVAREQIAKAIGGAIKLNNDELVTAIDSVRTGLDESAYSNKFERDRAFLRFAGELSALESVTQRELTNAEQQVALLENQLTALDLQVDLAQKQVDALFGVDNSVKSVGAAVTDLQAAMATYTGVVNAAMAQGFSSGGAPSGGGFSFGGGAEEAAQAGGNWTADGYWSKNADIRDYWNANAGMLERSRQFNQDPNVSARDEYLRWHYQTYGVNERRAYATGGYYPGGLALVGEEGPEIINFKNPGMVYTAAQTQGLLGGGGDRTNQLLSELLQVMRSGTFAQVAESKALSKVIRRWDTDGMPEPREVSA